MNLIRVAVSICLLFSLLCLAWSLRTCNHLISINLEMQQRIVLLEQWQMQVNKDLRALELMHEPNRDEQVINNQSN